MIIKGGSGINLAMDGPLTGLTAHLKVSDSEYDKMSVGGTYNFDGRKGKVLKKFVTGGTNTVLVEWL